MPKIQFGVTENSFEPLPDGAYDFQVTEIEQKAAKTGTPQIIVKTTIAKGAYLERSVWHFFALTEKAGYRLRELLDATGVKYDYDEATKQCAFDTDDLIGRYFTADATTRQREGSDKLDNNYANFRTCPISNMVANGGPAVAEEPRARRGATA